MHNFPRSKKASISAAGCKHRAKTTQCSYWRSWKTFMFPISFCRASRFSTTSFSSSTRLLKVRLSCSQRSCTCTATTNTPWQKRNANSLGVKCKKLQGKSVGSGDRGGTTFWVSMSWRTFPMSLLILSLCFSASCNCVLVSRSSASFCYFHNHRKTRWSSSAQTKYLQVASTCATCTSHLSVVVLSIFHVFGDFCLQGCDSFYFVLDTVDLRRT